MSKESYMIEAITRDLVLMLMEDTHIGMREAMEQIYKSKTFAALNNLSTGLYFQSPIYVYDMFCEERNNIA